MSEVDRINHMSEDVFVVTRGGETQALFPHAVSVSGGRTVYLSGQLAYDKDGNKVNSDMAAEMRQVCENLKAALKEVGGDMTDITKVTTYVTDMNEFFKCLDVRREYLGDAFPTSTTIEISRLADPDLTIEIEAWAHVKG